MGTRYDDGTKTTEDSIVRVCAEGGGGFVPAPGVLETVHPQACTSHIGDFVWVDFNGNGIQDAGEPGIPGVTLTLRDADGSPVQSATTDASGAYGFEAACGGVYTLDLVAPGGYASTVSLAGGNPGSRQQQCPVGLRAAPHGNRRHLVRLRLRARQDGWHGVRRLESQRRARRRRSRLAGVTVTLSGAAGGTAVSASDGTYAFDFLHAGSYAVGAPAVASGLGLSTAASLPVSLAAGQTRGGLDFGYAPARLSGVVFADLNKNGSRDAGEPGIGGVAIG